MNAILTLTGFDEGGIRENEGKLRLICNIEDGGKLALWGSRQNRHNIDAVLGVQLPCTVDCECDEPASWASERFGHTHWVAPGSRVEILAAVEPPVSGNRGN